MKSTDHWTALRATLARAAEHRAALTALGVNISDEGVLKLMAESADSPPSTVSAERVQIKRNRREAEKAPQAPAAYHSGLTSMVMETLNNEQEKPLSVRDIVERIKAKYPPDSLPTQDERILRSRVATYLPRLELQGKVRKNVNGNWYAVPDASQRSINRVPIKEAK